MKWTYGEYEHIANALSFTFTIDPVKGPRGQPIKQVRRCVLGGRVDGDDQEEISEAIAALETAYAVPNEDLIFLDDDDNPTPHQIISSESISGVTAKIHWLPGPYHGRGSGGSQYVNRRDFRILVEAEFDMPDQPFGGIVSWRETVTAIGTGGTEFVISESFTGTPVRDDTKTYTRGVLIQSGQAVGYDVTPTPPTPIFPSYNHPLQSKFSQVSPTQYLNSNRMYGIGWTYVMEHTAALAGTPTISVD